MSRVRKRVLAATAVLAIIGVGLGLGLGLSGSSKAPKPPQTAGRTSLAFAGRTVSVVDAPSGTSKVKYYDATTTATAYLGAAERAPWAFDLPAAVGTVQAQLDDTANTRLTDRVTTGSTPPSASPATSPPATTSPPPTIPSSSGSSDEVTVHDAAELQAALDAAAPGQTINLAAGAYTGTSRAIGSYTGTIVATRSGTAARPITVQGPAEAVVSGKSTGGHYGLYVYQAGYIVFRGFTVTTASKGIVSDGGSHNRYEQLTVTNVGSEGLHLRANSSDNVVTGSTISDTGMRQAQYGEGVYVGSANSNWRTYSGGEPDASNGNQIIGNTFTHIAAEGADLKEGTTSGVLADNVFDDTGYSGENSADSAIDAKGNGWTIRGNTIRNPQGADLDAIQTHTVHDGFGTGNLITGNLIEGAWPGFGIGLFPAAGNVVRCDNTAPDAAQGLVGANSKPVVCAA